MFHWSCMAIIMAASRAGLAWGSITYTSLCHTLQPSITADSSISTGMPIMLCRIIKV